MSDTIRQSISLRTPWPTIDPFLFTVHHLDHYPAADSRLGPDAALDGRQLGADFAGVDGWNMYHGDAVPGFPSHPHRGFETVTFVRRGLVDHADSLGASARYGRGDVQWLTAGAGIQHSEMFPLLDRDGPNTLELFQIWVNLPAADKMVDPHFTMFWDHQIPRVTTIDDQGRAAVITVVAGEVADATPPPPPPDSWASKAGSAFGLWLVELDAGGWVEPPAAPHDEVVRTVYFFDGQGLGINGEQVEPSSANLVDPCAGLTFAATADAPVQVLVLQGRPIGEPVAQSGPFVMTTQDELQRAFADFRRTQFGGWPWPTPDPTHGPEPERFALHADGRLDRPEPAGPHLEP
jgi:redox-sensitive bicupin YhaK (pirin superfamily)